MDPTPRLPAALYLVATPIGNLRDITLRALDVLKSADLLLAEDTRHTRKLLDAHGIAAHAKSCHQFNEAARSEWVADEVAAGRSVALVSDAGTPCISDPGGRLIRACRERGLTVTVIPGPSSVIAAASWSGWCDAGFVFAGFLSHKSAARRNALARFGAEPKAVVIFESPHRIRRCLEDLAAVLPQRDVFVAREMTKTFEQGVAGKPAELLAAKIPERGEFVLVLAPLRKAELASSMDSVHRNQEERSSLDPLTAGEDGVSCNSDLDQPMIEDSPDNEDSAGRFSEENR